MVKTLEIGSKAERWAAEYLMDLGFSIRHLNWRSGRYELDIVADKSGVLHFVEVKCRRKKSLTSPEDAITPTKFRSLQQAANAYIATYAIDLEVQFDLIAVEYDDTGKEIRYVPDAMVPGW